MRGSGVKFHDPSQSQRGSTLLAVVIAFAVIGGISYQLMTMSANAAKISARESHETEKLIIDRLIRNNFDCTASIASGCVANQTMRRANGAAVLPSIYTAPSANSFFTVRTSCAVVAGQRMFTIKVGKLIAGRPLASNLAADFHLDPLTSNPFTFNTPASWAFDAPLNRPIECNALENLTADDSYVNRIGGAYGTTSAGVCSQPNPYTGACTCSPPYVARSIGICNAWRCGYACLR